MNISKIGRFLLAATFLAVASAAKGEVVCYDAPEGPLRTGDRAKILVEDLDETAVECGLRRIELEMAGERKLELFGLRADPEGNIRLYISVTTVKVNNNCATSIAVQLYSICDRYFLEYGDGGSIVTSSASRHSERVLSFLSSTISDALERATKP